MTSVLLLLAGAVVTASATTVAVSAAAVSRLELTRWISRRLRGAAVATTLYAAPGRVLRTATAVGAAATLMTGLALAATLPATGLIPAMLLLGGIAVPLLAAIGYGIPRAVGRRWPERILRVATPIGERLTRVLSPLIPVPRRGARPNLKEVLLAGGVDDGFQVGEVRMISGVLTFTERQVRDVMTPRTDIVAMAEGASLEEVARVFTESGYSRIPVYRESLDNIVGMIYAFDLLKVLPGSELPIRPVAMTPGSKECAAVLLELQRARRQLAVVLDEFGGTAGIVTLEDLLEELVGEIFDEDDGVARPPGAAPELVEVDGATPGGEVAARFGVGLPSGAETIGGLLARLAGRIPQTGERLLVGELEFDIVAATPTKIQRVLIRRGPVRPVAVADRLER
jgi:CBS domain containing-hemolysin-like protein